MSVVLQDDLQKRRNVKTIPRVFFLGLKLVSHCHTRDEVKP